MSDKYVLIYQDILGGEDVLPGGPTAHHAVLTALTTPYSGRDGQPWTPFNMDTDTAVPPWLFDNSHCPARQRHGHAVHNYN